MIKTISPQVDKEKNKMPSLFSGIIFSSVLQILRLKFSLSSFNAFQNIFMWYLTWPNLHLLYWLTLPPSYISSFGVKIQRCLKGPPFLIHLQERCTEPVVSQPWSFAYCCLASVLGLGIARIWNLNLYWFLSLFNMLWSCNDLENTTEQPSRLSSAPVKGPLTRRKQADPKESKKSTQTQGGHSSTSSWMPTLFHPKLSSIQTGGLTFQLQWDSQSSGNWESVAAG